MSLFRSIDESDCLSAVALNRIENTSLIPTYQFQNQGGSGYNLASNTSLSRYLVSLRACRRQSRGGGSRSLRTGIIIKLLGRVVIVGILRLGRPRKGSFKRQFGNGHILMAHSTLHCRLVVGCLAERLVGRGRRPGVNNGKIERAEQTKQTDPPSNVQQKKKEREK